MGMYTEFHFNVKLKEDVPQEVVDVLKFMLGEIEAEPKLPAHPLFETDRWRVMLNMDSYYFHADTHSTLRFDGISNSYFLCIRCNFKNYDSEIEKFCHWITPYLDELPNNFLGFSRYEETEQPTLLFMKEQNEIMTTQVLVIINEQHKLTRRQIELLNEKFGNSWEILPVPVSGWTKQQIIEKSYELATYQIVFASPIPLLLREIAGGRGNFPLIFHNDRREKVERDGKISFIVPDEGWELL